MDLQHPYAVRDTTPPSVVTVDGDDYRVEGGTLTVPETVGEQLLTAWGARFDIDTGRLRVAETCTVEKNDGEVCGRDLPCPYHSDTED
jgi:hypothetical protein